jgi:uncharacterized protein (TIGR03437 family)
VLIGGARWAPVHAQNDTFGSVIPLPGHIDEVILDDARGLVYGVNFSAGRVEVVSMASNQRVSSFLVSTNSNALVAAAMSRDNQYLVAVEVGLQPGGPGPGSGGLVVINLNNPSVRQQVSAGQIPGGGQPLGIAFGHLGTALVVTTNSFLLFNPADTSFQTVFTYDQVANATDPPPDVELPVDVTLFPREVTGAHLTTSQDGRWIFGIARTPAEESGFIFSHRVQLPRGATRVRPMQSLVFPPAFTQVSAADDGSYFMAGDLLMTQGLRVIADTPEVLDELDEDDFLFGGHVIDSGIDTIYASFNTEVTGDLPGQEPTGVLNVMDADNLFVRQRIRIPERLSGRLVIDAEGEKIYGVGQSGLLYLPIGNISSAANLEIPPDFRSLLFEFNFCARDPQTQTLRIESPDGGSANFQLSEASGQGGLLFEPDHGTTPANVRVTVDPNAVGGQGTGVFNIAIQTDAVNIPNSVQIFANVRGVDQQGIFHRQAGKLVDILGDPQRARVYVLDQQNFQVLIFDSNDFRLLGTFRTGNTPTWMSLDNRGFYLLIANSRSENLTVINLDENRLQGTMYMPWETLGAGHYPRSVAVDNSTVLISTRVSPEDSSPAGQFCDQGGGEGQGRIVTMTTPSFHATKPATLGIYGNCIDNLTALVPAPNGSGIFLAMADGRTALWEALTRRLVLAREDFTQGGLKGAVGAGANFFMVDNHFLNQSLVRQLDFNDAGAGQESSGFTLLPNGIAVRLTRGINGVSPGILQQFNPANPTQILNSVRTVDQPPAGPLDPEAYPFTRTVAALSNGKLATIGTAGVIEFPVGYHTGASTPRMAALVNAADFTTKVASGGLVSLFGESLASTTASASSTPLPTVLGNVCVTANGTNLPLLYVSPTQINAQLPFNAIGEVSTVVHTSGGISDIFVNQVSATAPAVFSVNVPNSSALNPAIFRLSDDKLVTPSTPLRPNDTAVIFLTGGGQTTPLSVEGHAAPLSPLAETLVKPTVTIGETAGEVTFSGLVPGFVGLYQINVFIPGHVQIGFPLPLTVTLGSNSTTVNVRVVRD